MVLGEGDNTEFFPLPPSPFPDLCKKSNEKNLSLNLALEELRSTQAQLAETEDNSDKT
ncbi:hypothetical protein NIES4072_58960 [Nostoc commune NIES-4072]|uniref:Uncharacterized protein n=1 Tax=Nostoc commune NIES-4072 TaxID=2005467 RepID=A0A2R5FXK2_NOSCO|nr:hypothetical protein [Nostoc commune]BBD66828.1 hypothetical protein NIES4070_31970 [Nostoc commune HK-02]GBG22188.1 hypothetical protein NIES4072_58960 [Nostoc commune NIES-4072]